MDHPKSLPHTLCKKVCEKFDPYLSNKPHDQNDINILDILSQVILFCHQKTGKNEKYTHAHDHKERSSLPLSDEQQQQNTNPAPRVAQSDLLICEAHTHLTEVQARYRTIIFHKASSSILKPINIIHIPFLSPYIPVHSFIIKTSLHFVSFRHRDISNNIVITIFRFQPLNCSPLIAKVLAKHPRGVITVNSNVMRMITIVFHAH